MVRLQAGIFSERVIRHELEPATIEFAPCGDGGLNTTTMDDDYFEEAVNGRR
jgi:hypothetical protein